MPGIRRHRGFTLMEVMIGVFLSTVLISGIVQLLSGSVSAYRLQLSQSQLEESGRYARDVLITHIAQAGFQPEPWQNLPGFPALTDESHGQWFSGGRSTGPAALVPATTAMAMKIRLRMATVNRLFICYKPALASTTPTTCRSPAVTDRTLPNFKPK